MEFQPGKNTTSVVVGIVDDDVYGPVDYLLTFRLFTLNDDFVEIGPKSRLQILVRDDEVYTVNVASFTDFVTEGVDEAAVLVLEFQEPPGGSSVTPRISTIVRVTGGSARCKLNLTSHTNANVLSLFPKCTTFQFPVTIDHHISEHVSNLIIIHVYSNKIQNHNYVMCNYSQL